MGVKVKDPVCGMEIAPKDAVATEVHEGQTIYFCSTACYEIFVADPHRWAHPFEHGGHGEHGNH